VAPENRPPWPVDGNYMDKVGGVSLSKRVRLVSQRVNRRAGCRTGRRRRYRRA